MSLEPTSIEEILTRIKEEWSPKAQAAFFDRVATANQAETIVFVDDVVPCAYYQVYLKAYSVITDRDH